MSDLEILETGCSPECPYLQSVQGACGHELQSLLVHYLFENPDAPCPIYEEYRAHEMAELVRKLDQNG